MHCLRTSLCTSLPTKSGRCADVCKDVWGTILTSPRGWLVTGAGCQHHHIFGLASVSLWPALPIFSSSHVWEQSRVNTHQEQFPLTVGIQQPRFVASACPDHATKPVLILFAELVHRDVAAVHLYKANGFRRKVSTLQSRCVTVSLSSPYDSDFIAVIRLSEGKLGISTSGQHYSR